MPCFGLTNYRDTRRWLKCREAAARQMIAEGWNKHARKFSTVQLKRATRLYAQGIAA